MAQTIYTNDILKMERDAWIGNIQSRYDLGLSFYRGKHHKQNYQSAFFWFLQNAYNKHVASIYNVGIMYEAGDGVVQDYIQAQLFFLLAKELNDLDADYRYDELNEKLSVLQKQKVQELRDQFFFKTCSKFVESDSEQSLQAKKNLKYVTEVQAIPFLINTMCLKNDTK